MGGAWIARGFPEMLILATLTADYIDAGAFPDLPEAMADYIDPRVVLGLPNALKQRRLMRAAQNITGWQALECAAVMCAGFAANGTGPGGWREIADYLEEA